MDHSETHHSIQQVGIVGGGNMGQAILGGWLAATEGPASLWNAETFLVVDPGQEKRAALSEQYHVSCLESLDQLPACDMVLLAVKPQVMFDVLESMSTLDWLSDALFVSIAAGISVARLENALPAGTSVIRTMPNMPALVGEGMTAVCKTDDVTEEEPPTENPETATANILIILTILSLTIIALIKYNKKLKYLK